MLMLVCTLQCGLPCAESRSACGCSQRPGSSILYCSGLSMLHRTSGCQVTLERVHVRGEIAAAADGDADQRSCILRRSTEPVLVIMTASFTAA